MRTLGYIVIGESGALSLERCGGGPKKGLLRFYISNATLFSSRRKAKDAIKRSLKYYDRYGLRWGKHEIQTIRKAGKL